MEKDGMRVNAKSIMGLLTLACPLGSKIILQVEGADENQAFQELGKLIEAGFQEE
jgi:phosphotransferase system HPr (HPr) family protein